MELNPRRAIKSVTEVQLDNAAIRRFVNPTGADDPIVLALRRRQYLRTVRGLAASHDKLLEDCSDLASRTGFSDVLDYIGSSPTLVQHRVLGYPTVAFWVDVVLDLIQRRAHINFPELHIQTHLESFGRVGVAIAHCLDGCFECNTRLDSSAGISLPGTSDYYAVANAKPFELVRIEFKNGELSAKALEHDNELTVRRKEIPRVANFELNALDEDLRLPGRYDFKFDLPLRDADLIRWESPLTEGCNWINVSDARLGSEISTAVRAIIPVRSPNPEVHISATFKEAPGVMALSWTPDTPVLAEALVHEYHHGKLNTLFAADILIAGPTKEAKYYSPWRPDPRPLMGLLHGAFAFHAVATFWTKFLTAEIPFLHERRLRQRLCLLCRQTKDAVETLASKGSFTPTGSILIETLLHSVGELDSLVSTDPEISRRVERVMKEHKEHWEEEHGRAAARVRATLPRSIADAEREGIRRQVSIEKLAEEFPSEDEIIEDLTAANEQGRLDSALENWLQISTAISEPTLAVLAEAHAAYVRGNFVEAGSGYGALLQQYPTSRYFWQCFGHCLRHLNKIDLGTMILTNLTKLSAEARSQEPNSLTALSERTSHAIELLAPSGSAVA